MNATDRLCAALAAIAEVEVGISRFGSGDNPAWSIAGREFAHLQGRMVGVPYAEGLDVNRMLLS